MSTRPVRAAGCNGLVIRGRSRGLGLGSYALVAAKRRTEAMPSFEEAAEKVIAIRSGAWKNGAKSAKQWRASLSEYVYRRVGDKGVDPRVSASLNRKNARERHMLRQPI